MADSVFSGEDLDGKRTTSDRAYLFLIESAMRTQAAVFLQCQYLKMIGIYAYRDFAKVMKFLAFWDLSHTITVNGAVRFDVLPYKKDTSIDGLFLASGVNLVERALPDPAGSCETPIFFDPVVEFSRPLEMPGNVTSRVQRWLSTSASANEYRHNWVASLVEVARRGWRTVYPLAPFYRPGTA